MTSACSTVDQWKEVNDHRLVSCRWGCRMTPEACHAYQTRTGRYIQHFNGDLQPLQRVNAEYVSCFLPEPCPHLLSDEHLQALSTCRPGNSQAQERDRRLAAKKVRFRQVLADPNVMLEEEQWRRSLVSR